MHGLCINAIGLKCCCQLSVKVGFNCGKAFLDVFSGGRVPGRQHFPAQQVFARAIQGLNANQLLIVKVVKRKPDGGGIAAFAKH